MIGLEYICRTYKLSNKEVAEKLGVSPGTFHDWLSGRRKIPQNRIDELSSLKTFKDIPKEYYQKELDEVEKSRVVSIQLKNETEWEYVNDEYGVQEMTGNLALAQLNDTRTKYLETLAKIKQLIFLDSNMDLNEMMHEMSELTEIVDLFSEIIMSKSLDRYVLIEILYSVLIAVDERKGFAKRYKGFEDKELVKQLVEILKKENIKTVPSI